MAQYRKLSNNHINNFRILVRKAMLLERDEEQLFYAIPESVWEHIFKTNFNSELTYAEKVLLGHTEKIVHTETKYLERVKENIDNFKYALDLLNQHIDSNKKIIFITDYDNDGSLSQAIINQFVKVLPQHKKNNVIVEFARSVGDNKTRGFSYELVEDIANKQGLDTADDFLIITADNGVNSRTEQIKINDNYPNATLLITDHHNPEPDMMIIENEKTVMFNPHYFSLELTDKEVLKQRGINPNMTKLKQESYDFFKKYNISGATTIGLLMSAYIRMQNNIDLNSMSLLEQVEYFKNGSDKEYKNELLVIENLSKLSNMIDYVYTAPSDKPYDKKEIEQALFLQSLLNTNNTVSTLITNFITQDILNTLQGYAQQQNVEGFDISVFYEENKKIHALNKIAQSLLSQYHTYKKHPEQVRIGLETVTSENNLPQMAILNSETAIQEIPFISGNPNYIEQLRPFIYELTVNDEKTLYERQLLDVMIDVYKKLQISERALIHELRKIDIMEAYETENSTISILDSKMQHVFNRKLMNKAYNRANNGFNLTLDNVKENIISGSFRSSFKISEILNEQDREYFQNTFNINIETPGHEHAAGFIITSRDSIDLSIIKEINEHINTRINMLKQQNILNLNNNLELVVDLPSIDIVDRLNQVIRGNVAHFARITPVIKLDDDTMVSINAKTNDQTRLIEQAQNKYGWLSLNTQLPSNHSSGKSILIPNGMLKEVVEENFEPLIRLNYVLEGLFIGERIVHKSNYAPENIIELNKDDSRQKALIDYYEEQKNNNNPNKITYLSREDLKDNPFFKFNKFGKDDFEKFEQVIIGVIDSNHIDQYTVFDVEADGFGNARLLNIGVMTYKIDENSGKTLTLDEFKNKCITSPTGIQYILDKSLLDYDGLKEISKEEYENLRHEKAMSVLFSQYHDKYYVMDSPSSTDTILNQFNKVENIIIENDKVTFNRTLKGETVSYLVKPNNFVIPSTLTKLTGITNELAHQYGFDKADIDNMLFDLFKDKSTLFIAHNTEYDGRIARVNLPKFSSILTSPLNLIADSADFSKEYQLMYDNIEIVRFENISALQGYYFYNNKLSKLNIVDFVNSNDEGEFPDIKGKIHIVKVKNDNVLGGFAFYVKDMNDGVLTQINISYTDESGEKQQLSLSDLLSSRSAYYSSTDGLPIANTVGLKLQDIGYRAQGLGEKRFIRQMMIHDVDFDKGIIKLGLNDIKNNQWNHLEKHIDKLSELQQFYRFNKNMKENITDFMDLYPNIDMDFEDTDDSSAFYQQLRDFTSLFLEKNKEISNKYHDTWWNQSVLKTYEPILRNDLNDINFDIVSTVTGIPKEYVEESLNASYRFQQAYKKTGCKSVISNEEHMNGPYKGDIVGDIAYEDKATILLLSDKFTNKFSNETKQIVSVFNNSQRNYALKFLKQDILSVEAAMDSMSFKQYVHHINNPTPTIQGLAERHKNALDNKNSAYPVVKFKLSESYLQDGKNIYAVIRDDIKEPLTDKQIEEDGKKIAFILGCLQIGKNSGKNNIESIYNANLDKMLDYKKDLMSRYSYVEQNNSIQIANEYIKNINSYFNGSINITKLGKHHAFNPATRSNMVDGLDTIDEHIFKGIENLLYNQLYSTIRPILTEEIMDDIKKIEKNKNENNIEYTCKTEVGNFIAQLHTATYQLQQSNYEDIKKTFNGIYPKDMVLSDVFEQQCSNLSVSFDDVDNTKLEHIVKVLMLNSLAISHRHAHTTRLQQAIDEMRSGNVQYNFDHVESTNFLYEKNGVVSRQKPDKHLLEKMDYVQFVTNTLIDPEFKLKLDNEKQLDVNKQKIAKKHRI